MLIASNHLPRTYHHHINRVLLLSLVLVLLGFSAKQGNSQAISWSTPERDSTNEIGGAIGAENVGVANFNHAIYVAYAGPTTIDAFHDADIFLVSNTDGGTTYGNKTLALIGNEALFTSTNPALTVWNGELFMAYTQGNDSSGDGLGFLASSSDGIHWTNFGGSCHAGSNDVDGSPSLAVFNGNLYLGLRDHTTQAMILCRYGSDGSVVQTEYSDITANFAPSLVVFNNQLYAAIESNNTSHTIFLYTSPDGSTFTLNTGASSDQTSRTPSVAVYKGVLYLAFRENDSSDELLYKFSTDGLTFSSTVNAHFQNNGPPMLLPVNDLPGSPFNGQLFEFFATFSPTFLASSHGTN